MKQRAKYRVLIVAATEMELEGLFSVFSGKGFKKGLVNSDVKEKTEFVFLNAGLGMVSTVYKLTQYLSLNKVDLVVNIGICGAFKNEIKIGEVLNVVEDSFSELGAEDGAAFLSAFDIGLIKESEAPYKAKVLSGLKSKLVKIKNLNRFKKVNGITVNTVHGNTSSIKKIKQRLQPDVESMEGAAVFYVATSMGIPSLQLRAVSNYVTKRNRNAWDIPLALSNLNMELNVFLKEGIEYGN